MKGISPLLAAVLLIAITVALATLIMGWMSTITRTSQVKVENKTIQAIDCSAGGISIKEVYITAGATTASANVVVSNTGQTDDLQITTAQLLNITGSNFTATNVPITDFDKGDIETLTFSGMGIASCPSDFSKVIVTTNCGGVSDTFDTTPKCT